MDDLRIVETVLALAEARAARNEAFRERDEARAQRDELLAALRATETLVEQAQEILTRYLVPDEPMDSDDAISALLLLLDGPEQRRVHEVARTAIANASKGE